MHSSSTFLLLQPLKVFQAYGLALFYRKAHFLKKANRNPGRFEIGYLRHETNAAALWQSAHSLFLL